MAGNYDGGHCTDRLWLQHKHSLLLLNFVFRYCYTTAVDLREVISLLLFLALCHQQNTETTVAHCRQLFNIQLAIVVNYNLFHKYFPP